MGVARMGTAVVLFVDQVGSTAHMTQVGDAAADGTRRTCVKILSRSIESAGGTVVKWMGDGAAATFDSATSALNAAVEMQRGVDGHNRYAAADARLSIRVGISAGDVTWEARDVFGTPVVEAARLESAADPDSILCSDVVRILAGSRATTELISAGELELKGLGHPVRAWTVSWRTTEASVPPLPERLAVPDRIEFTGRADELSTLEAILADAELGRLRMTMIAGEPGAGKSRLAREFARSAHLRDRTVLAVRCDDGVGTPYWPFVQALRATRAWDAPMSDLLGDAPDELLRLLPSEGTDRPTDAPGGDEPQDTTRRLQLFEAVLSWLEQLASARPMVVVLDDLQWADPSTLDLVRFIMRAESRARLMIVITYRNTSFAPSAALERFLADAGGHDSVTEISVGGLAEPDVRALLSGDVDGLSRQLIELTGGNPFFITALVVSLGEGGTNRMSIPTDVADFIGRRLDTLDDSTSAMLEIAAVSGADVDVAVLTSALGHDAELIDAVLGHAVNSRFLVELAELPVRYRFAHAIVRDTLYDRIPVSRRARLHHRLGVAIEQCYPNRIEENLDRLVHHFSRGGDRTAIDRAARYGIDAGRAAMARSAHDQATIYFSAAVAALDHPQATANHVERCTALLELGIAQRRCRDPRARQTLLDVVDRAADIDQPELLIQAALANTPPWATHEPDPQRSLSYERALALLPPDDLARRGRLLADLSVERFVAGDQRGHRETADEALTLARRSGDASALAHVVHFRHLTDSNPDTVSERIDLALEVRSLVNDDATAWDISSWSIQCIGAALERGDFALADEAFGALRNLSIGLRDVNIAYHVRLMQTSRATIAGRIDEALRLADDMLEVGQAAQQSTAYLWWFGVRFDALFHVDRLDDTIDGLTEMSDQLRHGRSGPRSQQGLAIMTIARARAFAETGRLDEARRDLETFVDNRFAGISFDRDWLVLLCWAARVAWTVGDVDAAEPLAKLLQPYGHLNAGNLTSWLGRVDGHLALLDDTVGKSGQAIARLVDVADYHAGLPASAMHATTLTDLGEIASRSGHPDAAAYLSLAHVTAAPLGLTRTQNRVNAIRRGVSP